MASAAATHPSFPPRTVYGGSGKLPDRTAINNNPVPFGQSSMSKRTEPQPLFQQHPPIPTVSGPQGNRQNVEKEGNPLNDLSDEQKEEINEAVSSLPTFRSHTKLITGSLRSLI